MFLKRHLIFNFKKIYNHVLLCSLLLTNPQMGRGFWAKGLISSWAVTFIISQRLFSISENQDVNSTHMVLMNLPKLLALHI